jgi:SAM-dependent methyltransferase
MASDSAERGRWQKLGSQEPYWAVCTEERFRANSLSDQDREAFFASGETEVEQTFTVIRQLLGRQFTPGLSLDYGCGVGRLALPIARRSGRAIGVDISDTMLDEARANARRQRVQNVLFERPEEALAVSAQDLDFIHSYIVFQHIEPAVGMEISRALLRRLKSGGIGALHYSFERRASVVRQISHRLRKQSAWLNGVVNLVQGRPWSEPMIPVNAYDRSRISKLFEEGQCDVVHTLDTDHGGLLGSVFFLRKR